MNEGQADVIIIGGGPTGLACAIECKRSGLSAVILEKGCLVNSIYHFPANMIFFTTSELLEIGGVPFTTTNPKPTREEGLVYYKRVAQHHGLEIKTGWMVKKVVRTNGVFTLSGGTTSGCEFDYHARFVIIATGYYDQPNYLNVRGEKLSKVSHYYSDPHPFYDKDVLVVGGKNSACIAALELARYGAKVTVVHRKAEVKESVKYWILPDFLNRVKEGRITFYGNTVVKEIREESVEIQNLQSGAVQALKNDYVFALTGYRPDERLLKECGIELSSRLVPKHDPESLETNISGLFVAGSISAGLDTNKLFIENGRFHGKTIVETIQKR